VSVRDGQVEVGKGAAVGALVTEVEAAAAMEVEVAEAMEAAWLGSEAAGLATQAGFLVRGGAAKVVLLGAHSMETPLVLCSV